ncbi:methyltransferase domain-containing protein [Flavivirga algicola]|uniref:Class I SAM-dependent methyltransferase n=1 Tax=Flavivirga algicola TaxID=2729136 RepID=A0ABX1RVX3_9FLAO|nr:methyltransferase domain-containing protein [Flavivirga algicola]NMH86359.1 class I SAM-dependent methyltransferase [Flavivirga algicola]
MLKKVAKYILRKNKEKKNKNDRQALLREVEEYIDKGREPWSKGYHQYKQEVIVKSINDQGFLEKIKIKAPLNNYGYRLDERVVEYPWIFSKLNVKKQKLLDAGSTFNFDFIVNHPILKNKDLTIFTFAPESNNFCNKGVSYVYGDLRNIVFKDNLFDVVISQSTIEHIDMDNSIYGYDVKHNEDINRKSYDYILAVREMIRVLKNKGTLLLTFPFGKFENHGFFQQFDEEMLNKILELFQNIGTYKLDFFHYKKQGWEFAKQAELVDVVSYNPHTGKGKHEDGAAHCRSVVCIHFIKK